MRMPLRHCEAHKSWPERLYPGDAGSRRCGYEPLVGEEYFTLAKLLLPFEEVVRGLGGSPASLFEQAGIEPSVLRDPMARIPLTKLGELLEDTAALLGCPDLGLRLAERTAMDAMMQPLERLFYAAPTIADAFESCIRHMGAFNSGIVMDLDHWWSPDKGFLQFQLIDGLALYPQLIEQLLLLTHQGAAYLTGGFARSRTVWFSHLAISQPATYARRFSTIVRFGKEYDGLFFGRADLATPVTQGDAELFAEEARIVAERFPVQCKAIQITVRQAIVRVLCEYGDCTRENIAALLDIQERTLNRRLSKVGTSFEAIRDTVRRDLAFRYLARNDLSLTEIASRLGYSELAVLSRSCRRWFGAAPRQLRNTLMSARPAMQRSAERYLCRLVA